jgi:arylsulfatase A-like enzyme
MTRELSLVFRRSFLKAAAGAAAAPFLKSATNPPNIIFIYADDLGYGDLGCYGSSLKTPNLDALAKEGALFRQFYSASPVCSPSRAALLTGRYPVRTGVPNVLQPSDTTGLDETETTMAQMLKGAGYRTAIYGKWHLGSQPKYLPNTRGFDEFYGLPYSNDQAPSVLMRQGQVIETPVQLETLTQRLTLGAVGFIRRNQANPFFLYMAHTAPHQPLTPSPAFRGKSGMGLYGDTLLELDASVGVLMSELKELGLEQNTLVMFSSDNGPWFQGSPGRLRGRKGDTFEGGMREPFIARLPGVIPAGLEVKAMASTLDILPTVANLTGAALPSGKLDGVDILPLLSGRAEKVVRDPFLYFSGYDLQAIRVGQWKLHISRANTPAYTPEPKVGYMNLKLTNPELYNVDRDPEEAVDLANENPEVVASMQGMIKSLMPSLPGTVQAFWQATMGRPVLPNSSGSWPVPLQ